MKEIEDILYRIRQSGFDERTYSLREKDRADEDYNEAKAEILKRFTSLEQALRDSEDNCRKMKERLIDRRKEK